MPQRDDNDSITGVIDRPDDFDSFWRDTLHALAAHPPATLSQIAERRGDIDRLMVAFDSLDAVRIHAYLLRWRDDRPRPLVVYTHGYNGQVDTLWAWAQAGFDVLGFDTRGFGRSILPGRDPGWILTGIESPQTSILRGAVCDYVRALEVGQALTPLRSRTLAYGFSMAGAMALMAEAVSGRADMVAAGVPSFGWMQGRRRLVRQGSGHEVNGLLRAAPQREAEVMRTLAYFDTANFAALIAKPTLIGVGERDIIVPAPTVRAISNRLRCPHQVMSFPFSHTDRPEEALWQRFEQAWQRMLHSGQPWRDDPAAAPTRSG